MTKNTTVRAAIAAIEDSTWTPVRYPGAVRDPDTGDWISDAEVAEIPYTAFASTDTPVTARLIVRRVKDARYPDALFPVWRYHPFFTDSTEPAPDADVIHRRHAVIETVFADLIDGPLAHLPSGHFGANSAWVLCAAITHNLLRAAGTLAGFAVPAAPRCAARSSTSPPGWPARNEDPPAPTPPLALGPRMAPIVGQHNPMALTAKPQTADPKHRKSWADPRLPHAPHCQGTTTKAPSAPRRPTSVDRGLVLTTTLAYPDHRQIKPTAF